jgi:hypothetical protein
MHPGLLGFRLPDAETSAVKGVETAGASADLNPPFPRLSQAYFASSTILTNAAMFSSPAMAFIRS